MRTNNPESTANKDGLSDANQCIAVGLGIGGMGTAAALTLGATCPLCFVFAPVFVGAGLLKRRKEKRRLALENETEDCSVCRNPEAG